METRNGIKTFYARSGKTWRAWLAKNGEKEKSVWLIIYHKTSAKPSVYYAEAVEEALCFGWIDSKGNKRDDESSFLFFTRRNPKSNWSTINRERVAKMIDKGVMMPAGQAMIDLAKKTGTWLALDKAHPDHMPDDLKLLFEKNKTAFDNYQAFTSSSKRMILEWILQAKRPETRQRRIEEAVALAEKNEKANHPKKKA